MTKTTTPISEVIEAIVAKYPTEDDLLKHVTIIHPGDPVFAEIPFIDYIETDVLINHEQRKLVVQMDNGLTHTLSTYEIISLFEKYQFVNKLYVWLNDTNHLNDKNAVTRLNKIIEADKMMLASFIRNTLQDESALIRNTKIRMMPDPGYVNSFDSEDLESSKFVFIVSCGECLQLHLTLEDMRIVASHYEENKTLLNKINSIELYN